MNKRIKNLILLLVGITALFLVLQITINLVANSKLKELLAHREGQTHQITIDRIHFNLFTMTLVLKQVDISPISSEHAKATPQRTTVLAQIPIIKLRNINLLTFITDNSIHLNEILLNEPKFTIIINKQYKEKVKNQDSVHNRKVHFSGFKLNRIFFDSPSIIVKELHSNKVISSVEISDIEISGITTSVKNGLLEFSFNQLQLKQTMDKPILFNNYKMQFTEFLFSIPDSTISITDFHYSPQTSFTQLSQQFHYQKDVADLSFQSLLAKGIDFQKLRSGEGFFSSETTIKGFDGQVFRDKSNPFDTLARPLFPSQILKTMSYPLSIKTMHIEGRFNYQEQYSDKKHLSVDMVDLSAIVQNITSIKRDIYIDKQHLLIDMKTRLADEFDSDIHFDIPLYSLSDTFSFYGVIRQGKLNKINSILTPAFHIKVEEGNLKKLNFNAVANPYYSYGEMTMIYNDLKGSLLNNKKQKTKKFLSWLANTVIINSNPKEGANERTVTLFTDRVPYKGIGNFIWKTLQSGLMGTLFTISTNKAENQKIDKLSLDKKEIKRKQREAHKTMKKIERDKEHKEKIEN